MINMDDVLLSLSRQRPIFHSEADFQHALAWHIHQERPNAHVRLEYRLLPQEPLYLDLWIQDTDSTLAIELKYPTRRLIAEYAGERFSLNNQGAEDTRRYDFVKDIARLERVVKVVPDAVGYAIFLTNDSLYWAPGRDTDTMDAAFRIHEGVRLSGPLTWSENVGTGTSKKREATLELNGSYPIMWHDYSLVANDQRAGRFRYVSVRVNRNEPRIPASPHRPTWDALYGVASNGQEPPTDEQIEQWLDERRITERDS